MSAASPAPARLSADERREQLVNVAVDLFSRKGFNGTTTREIANAAGVTEAIIYRHFKTKEQLYTAIIDQRLNSPDTEAWLSSLKAVMEQNDDEAVVREIIAAIIATHKTDPKFERLMLYAALEGNQIALLYMRQLTAAIVDAFKTYFARRQKQKHLRKMAPEVALTAIAGMAQHYARCKYLYALDEKLMTDEQAIDHFTRIAIDGLCLKPRPQ